MKKGILFTAAFALAASAALAAPTLDGNTNDADYWLLGSTSDTSYGDQGVRELKAWYDATDLYIAVTGYPANDFTALMFFIGNTSDTDGVPSGTGLPRSNNGFTPFENWSSIYDFNVEYGFRFNRGGGTGDATVSIMDYSSNPADKSQADFSLHQWQDFVQDGTVITAPGTGSSNAFDGVQFAAIAQTNASTALSNNQGFEIKFPLSVLPAVDTTDLVIHTHLIGSDGHNFSSNLIPAVGSFGTGDIGTGANLGDLTLIDWPNVAGDQFVAVAQPSSVSSWDLY